jgi:superfamily II DNA or RNA helicase
MVALATRPIAAPITPRWYQEEAVKAALDKDGPALINLPTGCGKSLVLFLLCYAPQFLTKRVMILGEHLEILLESRKTILMMDPNADVGVVGFGFAEWDHRILLGGLDTLVIEHRIDKLKTLDIALILVDECFVAGTMIGDTPIENIKPGDIVTAFDEKTQTFSQKKVVRLFKNPVGNRLVKIICDGKETVCTPNHPFYTHSGWKRAEELILEDKLLFFENNLWKKINAIEIYKPGNDGTFGGLCTDGYVYNFEVEDVHTYTANGIVVHNCHHAYTNADEDGNNPDPSQYDKIFTACKEAKLVGVTATVDRADGKDITQVFGPPVYAKGIMEMIEKGYLCSLRNFIVRTTNVLNVQSVNGDYNQTKLEQAVNRKDRNSLIVETCIDQKYGGPDIPTVAFCTGKDHAKALAQEFNSRGIPTAVVTDEVRGKERKQIFADFAIGKIKVICNILVLAEGWDANVWRVVLASPTKSRPRYAQMIGRGTRNYPGKQFCYIVDFTDNTMSHSLDPVHLDDIIGFPVPEGADVREAVKQIKEKQAREGGEEKEEKGVDAAGQKVVAQEINVVNVPWVKDTTGTFRVDIDHSCVVLYPIGNGNYHVVMNMKRSAKSPDNVVPVAKNIPLQWAMGVAEHKVKHLQAKNFSILDPNAPWRREKMTQSQYQTINGLQKSINRPEHYKRIDTSWNKEQAANRIEELIRIKQAMPKAPRAPKKTKKQKAS